MRWGWLISSAKSGIESKLVSMVQAFSIVACQLMIHCKVYGLFCSRVSNMGKLVSEW